MRESLPSIPEAKALYAGKVKELEANSDMQMRPVLLPRIEEASTTKEHTPLDNGKTRVDQKGDEDNHHTTQKPTLPLRKWRKLPRNYIPQEPYLKDFDVPLPTHYEEQAVLEPDFVGKSFVWDLSLQEARNVVRGGDEPGAEYLIVYARQMSNIVSGDEPVFETFKPEIQEDTRYIGAPLNENIIRIYANPAEAKGRQWLERNYNPDKHWGIGTIRFSGMKANLVLKREFCPKTMKCTANTSYLNTNKFVDIKESKETEFGKLMKASGRIDVRSTHVSFGSKHMREYVYKDLETRRVWKGRGFQYVRLELPNWNKKIEMEDMMVVVGVRIPIAKSDDVASGFLLDQIITLTGTFEVKSRGMMVSQHDKQLKDTEGTDGREETRESLRVKRDSSRDVGTKRKARDDIMGTGRAIKASSWNDLQHPGAAMS